MAPIAAGEGTELAAADKSIRTRLWREKRQKALTDLVEGLRKKEKPVVNADLDDLVKLEDMDRAPSSFAPEHKKSGSPHDDKPAKGGQ